jgi:hypothetical protein
MMLPMLPRHNSVMYQRSKGNTKVVFGCYRNVTGAEYAAMGNILVTPSNIDMLPLNRCHCRGGMVGNKGNTFSAYPPYIFLMERSR